MRAVVSRLYSSRSYTKAIEWGKLIAITGSAQAAIQGFSLISGILVIRFLPTKEYALYTLANTMLGTIVLVADGGIASGVMAYGGRIWQDKDQLGATIATGFGLRKKFASVCLCITVPILLFLLHHHGANWVISIVIVLSLVPAFLSALSGTLLEIAPRLHQDIAPLQKIEVGVSIGRLAMICLTLFAFPWAFIAILSSGLPQIWANKQLKKLSSKYLNRDKKPDTEIQKEIIPVVKRVLPGALYYCVSGQITIWICSFYGSTEAIAQIGALGRLGMLLNMFNTLFATLVIPRFARLPNNKNQILGRFLQSQILLLFISVLAISTIVIFPAQALAILGKNYSNLTHEVLLVTISSCISMAAGVTYSISISRGWVLPPVVNIAGNIIVQALLIFCMDLSKVNNVLWFSIINASAAYVMLFIYFISKNLKVQNINPFAAT